MTLPWELLLTGANIFSTCHIMFFFKLSTWQKSRLTQLVLPQSGQGVLIMDLYTDYTIEKYAKSSTKTRFSVLSVWSMSLMSLFKCNTTDDNPQGVSQRHVVRDSMSPRKTNKRTIICEMFISVILARLSWARCQQVETTVTGTKTLLLYQCICFNILFTLTC